MRRLLALLPIALLTGFIVAVPGVRASAVAAPISSGGAGWGMGTYNQANLQGYKVGEPVPAARGAIPAGADITKVLGQFSHACAIADGRAYCWGYPSLGDARGAYDRSGIPVAVDTSGVLQGKTIVDMSFAMNVICALTADNLIACWGANYNGELGDGTFVTSSAPVAVDQSGALAGKTIVSLAAARSTLCALDDQGQAYCWGSNNDATVGTGSGDSNVPVAVHQGNLGPATFATLGSGTDSLCGVTTLHEVFCWGGNTWGQLGDGSTSRRAEPVAVTQNAALGADAISVSAGRGFTCALRSNGEAACWGRNSSGQLGDGTSGGQSTVPVAVAEFPGRAGRPITDLLPTEDSTCVIVADEDTFCWGYSDTGTLGNGTFAPDLTVPTAITDSPVGLNGATLTSLVSLSGAVCGVSTADAIYCWGGADVGQTSTGAGEYSYYPTPVLGLELNAGETYVALEPGYEFTCGLTSAARLLCWGYDGYGALGNGSTSGNGSFVPVEVGGALVGKTVVSISAGESHICALTDAAEVYCWGSGSDGSLGNGDTNDEPFPVLADLSSVLPAGRTVAAISAGGGTSCALDNAGAMYCWGAGGYGQLGDGQGNSSDVPVPVDTTGVLAGKVITAMDVDFNETCVLDSDGNAYCWGSNTSGSLGNGDTSSSGEYLPVAVDMAPLSGGHFDSIDVGESQVCGVSTGQMWCWGNNGNGQLGTGDTTDSSVPAAVDVSGAFVGKTISDIAVGAYVTCAVDTDGSAYCWGQNDNGQNGNGTQEQNESPTPVALAGTLLSGARFVSIQIGGETATVLGILAPARGVPDAPIAPAVTARTEGRAKIQWTAPGDGGSAVTDYVVQASLQKNGPWTVPSGCEAVGTATSCVGSGFGVRANYYFRIAAVNDNGQGAWARARLIRAPKLVISGDRAGNVAYVAVSGDAAGLMRRPVTMHVKIAGESKYTTFEAGRVDAAGRFLWSSKIPQRVRIYASVDEVRSNRIIISNWR